MIYSANGKGAWPPVATERELHVGLMLSPQKCLLWLSCVAEITVGRVLKRNLGIKCALFTIDWLLGLGQGLLTQFQRIAWKLLRKLEPSNLFLPMSPSEFFSQMLASQHNFPLPTSVAKKWLCMCQSVSLVVFVAFIFQSFLFLITCKTRCFICPFSLKQNENLLDFPITYSTVGYAILWGGISTYSSHFVLLNIQTWLWVSRAELLPFPPMLYYYENSRGQKYAFMLCFTQTEKTTEHWINICHGLWYFGKSLHRIFKKRIGRNKHIQILMTKAGHKWHLEIFKIWGQRNWMQNFSRRKTSPIKFQEQYSPMLFKRPIHHFL